MIFVLINMFLNKNNTYILANFLSEHYRARSFIGLYVRDKTEQHESAEKFFGIKTRVSKCKK